MPEPGNPQALNRYAYVLNNPLRYNDPSGHCPWCIGAAIGAVVGAVVGAATAAVPQMIQNVRDGQPLTANIDPGEVGKAAVAGAVAGAVVGGTLGWGASALGLVGAGEGGTALVSGATAMEASATAEAAATAACADGDCTNEVRVITQVGQNVWELSPLQRGIEVEKILGRSKFLSQNFPVIDRFEEGVATSIKSLDLNASTYQNTARLASTVMRYTRTLAQWEGQAEPWGRVQIHPAEIQAKVLELAVPPGGSPAQWETLFRVRHIAAETGVRLDLVIIR